MRRMARRWSRTFRFGVGGGLLALLMVGQGAGWFDTDPGAGADPARSEPMQQDHVAGGAFGGESAPAASAVRETVADGGAEPEQVVPVGQGRLTAAQPTVPLADQPTAESTTDRMGDQSEQPAALPSDVPPAPGAEASDAARQPAVAPATAGAQATVATEEPKAFRLALAGQVLGEGRVGEAAGVLDRLVVDFGAEDPELVALGQRLDAMVAVACEEMAQRLRAGEVFASHRLLWSLLDPASSRVDARLTDFCSGRGWPALRLSPAATESTAAVDVVLPRGRAVRVPVGDGLVRGRVISCADGEVTVRAVTPQGVSFPTMSAYAVEPEAVTAEEAVALAWAALHGGARDYAGLWAVCALQRLAGAEAPAELLTALR
jgi:hypothetical protein